MPSFADFNLHPSILKAIDTCGYTQPTPVQEKSIPHIMQGKDVVASAQTGTGKTAAFVLPALHILSTKEQIKKTRILILTPTRELAGQITKAASLYGKFLNYNIVSLVGGMPYHNQIRDLSRGADIIVATPGRLLDHMEQKRVDLSGIEMLVLDEADRMLDMGFIEDVEYIAKLTPSDRQTLLFSATVDNKLLPIVRHLMKNPVRVDLSNEKLAVPLITQEMYKVNNVQHKTRMLHYFLTEKNIFKAIIFSATKIMADKLAAQLREFGFAAAALHGDLKQNVRNRTIESLTRGKIQYLVATDVAARGLDISDITHVFNYDMPRFCEDYVHRIGRTGRAGKTGTAISFILPADTKHLQRIERFVGQRLKVISNLHVPEITIGADVKPFQDELSNREFRHGDGGGRRPSFRGKDRQNDRFARSGDRQESGGYSRPRKDFSHTDDRAPKREYKQDDSSYRAPKREYKQDDSSSSRAPKRAFSKDDGGSYRAPKREYSQDDSSYRAPKREYSQDDSSYRAPKREYSQDDSSYRAPKREYSQDDSSSSRPPKRAFKKDYSDDSREGRGAKGKARAFSAETSDYRGGERAPRKPKSDSDRPFKSAKREFKSKDSERSRDEAPRANKYDNKEFKSKDRTIKVTMKDTKRPKKKFASQATDDSGRSEGYRGRSIAKDGSRPFKKRPGGQKGKFAGAEAR